MDPMEKLGDGDSFKHSVAVIGAGAFGTALAEIAARGGNDVRLYARNQEVVDNVNEKHVNPHYLSEFELSPKIKAYNNVKEAIENVDFVILAIPTQLVSQYNIITLIPHT